MSQQADRLYADPDPVYRIWVEGLVARLEQEG